MEVTDKQELYDRHGQQLAEVFTLGDKSNVLSDGPLAKACEKVLSELYKREYDPITGVALETQQMDQEARKRWLAAKEAGACLNNRDACVGVVYGVVAKDATSDDLSDVVETVVNMRPQEIQQSAIVLSTQPGETSTATALAIEAFARDNGIAVYRSFADLVKHHAR